MKHFAILLSFLLASLCSRAQIVYSDYSDPDICVGTDGDYWMTASSFQCTPGLPILHSTVLVHWRLVNYALPRLVPEDHYSSAQHGNGVWAPSIRLHQDTYYIYWGDPDYGVFMVKTTDPAGKWEEPVLVMPGKGVIDTCPLWDEDGKAYLVNGWANSRCGFNSVLTVRQLSPDGTHVIGNPVMVYDGLENGDFTIEGPKFYKKNGYYYILAPAGGVETGWQVALRSKSPFGPYEQKIVFNKDGIHQGGWIVPGEHENDGKQGKKGSFICFQERGAYGRILHLLDVEMKDGWPMMKEHKGVKHNHNLIYDSRLLQYQWHANYQDSFGFPVASGKMRINSHLTDGKFTNIWDVPNLFLKKFDGETFSDTLSMTIRATAEGQQSGLIIMGRDYVRYSVNLQGDAFTLSRCECKDAEKGKAEQTTLLAQGITSQRIPLGIKTVYGCHVSFIIRCAKGGLCTVLYSIDGSKYQQAGAPFQAREGKWIGAKYGAFSVNTQPSSSRGWCEF